MFLGATSFDLQVYSAKQASQKNAAKRGGAAIKEAIRLVVGDHGEVFEAG